MNNIQKLEQDYANELLDSYEVDIRGGNYIAIRIKGLLGDQPDSVFFAQDESAENLINNASGIDYLTTEQAIILYLDSAGALQ